MAKTKTESFSASEVRSGFLVSASVVCLAVLLFLAGKSQLFKDTYQVEILFDYISGLAKNAPVHFAGHEVGKVTAIRLSGKPRTTALQPWRGGITLREKPSHSSPSSQTGLSVVRGKEEGQIIVTARIPQEIRLRQNSQAFIDLLGFMGEKFLDISPGSAQAPFLPENEMLRGTDPVPLNELMKQGMEIADELEKTTVSLQELIQNLNQVVGENRAELSSIFDNLNTSSENLKEMTHDLKLHPWKLLKKGKEKKGKEEKKT